MLATRYVVSEKGKLAIQYTENLLDDAKFMKLLDAFRQHARDLGLSIVTQSYPHVRKFIVIPMVNDGDFETEKYWRTPARKSGNIGGKDLVNFLDYAEIRCLPCSLNNTDALKTYLTNP
jgi:hypothetical protein